MFRIFDQLPREEKALQSHIGSLKTMTQDGSHERLFEHLYETLSILDTKSSSMLAFNSLITAVFSIFLATSRLSDSEFVLANLGVFCVIISCVLLLTVVWVHWSTTDDLADSGRHAMTLLLVRRS